MQERLAEGRQLREEMKARELPELHEGLGAWIELIFLRLNMIYIISITNAYNIYSIMPIYIYDYK